MSTDSPRVLVTAATGQLGRLVVAELLKALPAGRIAVTVRDPAKAAEWAAAGVRVHRADYADPAGWDAALAGVDRVLLISSSELGQRVAQHRTVIAAARRAGVSLLAYTSVLHADTSVLGLAAEHRATEADVRASGVPFALLRNGFYTENYLMGIDQAIAHGAVAGSAGAGRIAAAARADYAAAAAAVLRGGDHAGRTYELAGDEPFTMADFAAAVGARAGRPVAYRDLPEAAYRAMLESVGLPAAMADLVADSSARAADGALFDDGRQLSRLIGRPTTQLADVVAAAVPAA